MLGSYRPHFVYIAKWRIKMKYKVIGWTSYDSRHQSGEITYASQQAIIDDIREHNYKFTGWHHQESINCVPILNDGKVRRYSQRSWGAVMAKAYGYNKPMDYAKFAFYVRDLDMILEDKKDENIHTPKLLNTYYPGKKILSKKELSEVYELDKEKCKIKNDCIQLILTDELRYVDRGDVVKIKDKEFVVKSVEWDKNVSEKIKNDILFTSSPDYEEAVKVYEQAETIISIFF